jgi:hypothetical protein
MSIIPLFARRRTGYICLNCDLHFPRGDYEAAAAHMAAHNRTSAPSPSAVSVSATVPVLARPGTCGGLLLHPVFGGDGAAT